MHVQKRKSSREYSESLQAKMIGQSTVCDILKHSEKWLTMEEDEAHFKRARQPKYSDLEKALFLWFMDVRGDLNLTNVKLVMLPPNVTAHLQPLDAGIIMNFKTHYRKLQTVEYLRCIENDKPTKIDIKQALYFVRDAWHSVT